MPQDETKKSWDKFLEGLKKAGEIVDRQTAAFSPEERADGFRALVRALAANVDKVEADGAFPLPIHDNQPNHKWFLENPDGYYLHMTVDPAHVFRLTGHPGDACYTSFTVYEGKGDSLATKATATFIADELITNPDGSFEIAVSRERPESARNWIPLTPKSGQLWVRQLFNDIENERRGHFRIGNTDPAARPPVIAPAAFAENLERLGFVMNTVGNMMFVAYGLQTSSYKTNTVREWTEMKSGAMFTSDDIDYQIGSWQLEKGQALLLEGECPQATHWNIVLYSRYLNSLEHRYRQTSLTGGRIALDAGRRFRIVISGRDPGFSNWLDTEGRTTGLFVIRAVGADAPVAPPAARVVDFDKIAGSGNSGVKRS